MSNTAPRPLPGELLSKWAAEYSDALHGLYLTTPQLAELTKAIARREQVVEFLKTRAPVTVAEWDAMRAEVARLKSLADLAARDAAR